MLHDLGKATRKLAVFHKAVSCFHRREDLSETLQKPARVSGGEIGHQVVLREAGIEPGFGRLAEGKLVHGELGENLVLIHRKLSVGVNRVVYGDLVKHWRAAVATVAIAARRTAA